MNHFCRIFVSFFIAPLISQAANYLDFPADKNNILSLPQKFEYSLRDATKLLLGNRIIDTRQFHFQISPSENSVEVTIQWPHNVIESGRIIILNPSGVAIWSQSFKDGTSSYSIPNATALVQNLAGLSFFRFCAGYYEIDTGLNVCSPEMIVKGGGRSLTVTPRPYNRKAFVQINGRAVTPHGIVFLNDERESLSFRATSASGAEFKMDTRRIKLEFVDVIDVDDKNFAISVEGPTPLSPLQFKKISAKRWSVVLKKERPMLYIAGEGKVPLRQEFVVQGALPTEGHRLYLDNNSSRKTYASQVTLQGRVAEKGIPRSVDNVSEVSVAGQQFSWTIKSVPRGKERISYLQTQDENGTYTAGYTISRQDSGRLELLAGLNSDETHFYAGGEAQLWFEKLPFAEKFTTQRLGLGLIYNQDLSGDAKVILTELDLFYRLWQGLQFWEPSFIVGSALQNWSFDSQTLQTTSLLLGWQGPGPKWLVKRYKNIDWQEYDLKYSMPGKTSSIKLNSNLLFRWKVYQRIVNENKLRYSLGLFSQEVQAATVKSQNSGLLVEAAWVMTF